MVWGFGKKKTPAEIAAERRNAIISMFKKKTIEINNKRIKKYEKQNNKLQQNNKTILKNTKQIKQINSLIQSFKEKNTKTEKLIYSIRQKLNSIDNLQTLLQILNVVSYLEDYLHYLVDIDNKLNEEHKFLTKQMFINIKMEGKGELYEMYYNELDWLKIIDAIKINIENINIKRDSNDGVSDSDSDSDDGDSDSDDNGSKVVNQENLKLVENGQRPKPPPLGPKQLAKQISAKRKENGYVSNNVQQQIAKVYNEQNKQNPTKKTQKKVVPPQQNKQNTETVKVPKAPLPTLEKNTMNPLQQNVVALDQINVAETTNNARKKQRKKVRRGKGDPSEKYRTKDVGTKRGALYDSVSLRF